MSPVETCRACGRLSGFLPRGVCVDCQEERERCFRTVREYLREHPGASIVRTAADTGVADGLIVAWIREGRLEYAGPDRDRLESIDHDEDVKARIRAQLAAAGAEGTDPHGPAAAAPAHPASHLGMRSRSR